MVTVGQFLELGTHLCDVFLLASEFLPSPFILSVMAPISSSTLNFRQLQATWNSRVLPLPDYLPGKAALVDMIASMFWEGFGDEIPTWFLCFLQEPSHAPLVETDSGLGCRQKGWKCGLQTKNDGVFFPVLPLSTCVAFVRLLYLAQCLSVK